MMSRHFGHLRNSGLHMIQCLFLFEGKFGMPLVSSKALSSDDPFIVKSDSALMA